MSAQNTFDMAKAKRDSAAANVQNQDANLTIAKTNLGYTRVAAPFDGVVTRHLVSVGELVGRQRSTKLATIVQLDPIYVTFNVSEQDVLNIRANLKDRRISLEEINKVPLEIGLMTEEGFPHKGHLNYVSPEIDANTGTVLLRGLFENPTRALLPGFFVRVRAADSASPRRTALLVPDRGHRRGPGRQIPAGGQQGRSVEQRRVTTGMLLPGSLRVIDKGLNADDRVVISTNGRAIPGRKVVPKPTTIQPPPASEVSAAMNMISKFFIDRPVLANVLAIVIVLIGGVAAFSLPIAQYPNIVPPTVSVTTTYPGASAATVSTRSRCRSSCRSTASKA